MASDYEVLNDLQANVLRLASESGIEKGTAEKLAKGLREHFRQHWGGQLIYFTKGKELSGRDLEAYREWNGRNRDELVKKYNLSVGRLYQIIKNGKAIDAREREDRKLSQG